MADPNDPNERMRRARVLQGQEKPQPEDAAWMRQAGIDPRLIPGGREPFKADTPTTPKDVTKGALNWAASRGTDIVSQTVGMPDAVYQWMRRVQEERNADLKKEIEAKNKARKPGEAELSFNPQPTPERLEIPYNIWGDKSVPGGDVRVQMPTGDEVKQSIMSVTGHKDTPTFGVLGPDIDAAISNVAPGMALKYGRTAQGVVQNIFGGVAGYRAGELPGIKDTTLDLPASMLAGNVGSKVGSVPFRFASTPGKMIRDATKGVDWDAAIQRHRESRSPTGTGNPRLMGHEAIADDINHPIAQLAAAVLGSGKTAKLGKFAKERKASLDRDFDYYMERYAPGGPVDQRTAEANLGTQSKQAVLRPQQERATAAQPHFDAAFGQPPAGAPPGTPIRVPTPVDPMVATQMYSALMQRSNTAGPVVTRLAEQMRGEFMNATTVQQFNETINKYKSILRSGAFEGEKIPDDVRSALKPILQSGKEGLASTNADYAAGLGKYRIAGTEDPMRPGRPMPSPETQRVLDVEGSPTKTISENPTMEGFRTAAVNPRTGANPQNIKDTIDRLKIEDQAAIARARAQGQTLPDPQTAQKGFRRHLEDLWDTAFTDTQGAPGIYGGAKFRKQAAGSDAMRANTQAWVEGITGSTTAGAGFNKFLDILQRTGYTPNLGSPTASRARLNEQASTGSLPQFVIDLPSNLVGKGPISQFLRERQHGKTFAKLGDILTDPDAVVKMQRLAMLDPDSPKAKAIVLDLYNTVMGVKADVTSPFPEAGETKETYR